MLSLLLLLSAACSQPETPAGAHRVLDSLDSGPEGEGEADDTAGTVDTEGDDTAAPASPEAVLVPDAYDFGTVFVGCTGSVSLTVSAEPDGVVAGVEVVPADGFTLDTSAGGSFPWMGAVPFGVTFAPGEARTYDAHLAVTVERGDTSYFPLSGNGDEAGGPCDE